MTSHEWQVRQTNHFVIVWWAHSVTATVHVSLTGLQNYLEHQMRETISEDEKKWNFLKKEASSFFSMTRRDATWRCSRVAKQQAAMWVMPVATGCCWRNGIISLLGGLTDWVQQKCNKAASLDILNSSEKTYSYLQTTVFVRWSLNFQTKDHHGDAGTMDRESESWTMIFILKLLQYFFSWIYFLGCSVRMRYNGVNGGFRYEIWGMFWYA